MGRYPKAKNYGRSRYRPYSAGIGSVARAVARAVRGAYGGSRTRTYKMRRRLGGIGATTQYDRKVIYTRKPMPARKKRKWKSFVKKVNAVVASTLGTRTVLFNDSISATTSTTNQAALQMCLYGMYGIADGTDSCGFRDIRSIIDNDPNFTATATGKCCFKSGVIDITYATPTTNTAGCELDVYEIEFPRKMKTWSSLFEIYDSAAAETGTISGAGTGITLGTRGATPFEFPEATVLGRLRILKKTKYMLPPGTTATYQYRDPRNVWMNENDTFAEIAGDDFVKPKFTRAVLAVFKAVIGGVGVTLNAGVTRKYTYVINESDQDADQVL